MQTQTEQPGMQAPPVARRWRALVQLAVTPKEYAQLKRCARKTGLPFATWLRHVAMEELRKSSL